MVHIKEKYLISADIIVEYDDYKFFKELDLEIVINLISINI